MPFFKSGNLGSVGSKTDVSQADRSVAGRETVEAVSLLAKTEQDVDAAPSSGKSASTTQPEPKWESLIETLETEPATDAAPVVEETGEDDQGRHGR